MSVSLIMTNFSAGELSPRLGGRVDLAKYSNGLSLLENMFTHPHGGASRRPGFRFISESVGRDLMPDGSLNAATGWTVGTGWTVASAKAVCDGSQSASSVLSRDIGLVKDKIYEINFTVSGYGGGEVTVCAGGGAVSVPVTADETYTFRSECGASKLIEVTASADFVGTIESLSVRESGPETRLIPFEFSTAQAYVLAFTDKNVRIFKNGGVVVDDDGKPVEVSTPYTESDLEGLRFTQSADVMYLVHPEVQPYKLSRSSHIDWKMELVPFTSPPSDWNSTKGYPSCVTFF